MVESLLKTKTYIPSPGSNLVPRPHLIDRLEAGFQQGLRLILVSAPAGSGKTTLVSDWIKQSGHPAAWLSLDEDDNDLSRFLTLLITTLKVLHPGLSDSLFALARSSGDVPPKAILVELINELDTFASPFVLVLDDYDAVQSESIHKSINYLIDNRPPSLHVVLVGRVDPPLSLSRWRARGQLSEFHAADLRFSQDETTSFFKTVVNLELSDQDIASLDQSIEGWAAGLQLVSLALKLASPSPTTLQESPDPHHFLSSLARTNKYIVDYLIEEVYNRQSENVQSFLLQTSILNRLCASLCVSVVRDHSGPLPISTSSPAIPTTLTVDESQSMLEYLERSNLFLIPLDTEMHWYRYHPLFAGTLSNYLRSLQPEQILLLNRRASQWFEENGYLNDAIYHALAGQDFEASARLVELVADAMLWSQGEYYRLYRWLGSIPSSVMSSHPRLLLSKAWVELWSYQYEKVEPLIQTALHSLPKGDALRTAYLAEAAAIETELARLQEDFPLMQAKAEEARQLLAQLPHKTSSGSVILGIIASAYRANGDVTAAYRAYAEAGRMMEVEGKIPPALIANGYQIHLLALQGELQQAGHLYQHAREWAEGLRARSASAYGLVLIEMGDVLREQNDLVEAERLLREGIRISLQTEGLADDTFDGLLSLARLLQASGDFERADAVVEQADRLAQKYHVPNAGAKIAVWKARFALLRGKPVSAERWMQARGLNMAEQINYPQEDEYLLLARCLIEQDLAAQAGDLLSRLLAASEAGGRLGRSIEILGMQALASHQAGKLEQALTSLARAFELGEPEGYVRTFVDEGPRMEKLLRQAVSHNVSIDYVTRLLSAFKPSLPRPVQIAPGTQTLVDPLTARELEVLRLMSAGLTNREIADEFFVSIGTVKSHINKIYRKLDVINRVRAISRAKELNLL
jgi:LuxR family maltose regulon positive regulatory protein